MEQIPQLYDITSWSKEWLSNPTAL